MVGKRNKNKVAHLLGELGELKQDTKDHGKQRVEMERDV